MLLFSHYEASTNNKRVTPVTYLNPVKVCKHIRRGENCSNSNKQSYVFFPQCPLQVRLQHRSPQVQPVSFVHSIWTSHFDQEQFSFALLNYTNIYNGFSSSDPCLLICFSELKTLTSMTFWSHLLTLVAALDVKEPCEAMNNCCVDRLPGLKNISCQSLPGHCIITILLFFCSSK